MAYYPSNYTQNTYFDRRTGMMRTWEQDQEIKSLREQLEKQEEQKKLNLKQLIGYYYMRSMK